MAVDEREEDNKGKKMKREEDEREKEDKRKKNLQIRQLLKHLPYLCA